MKTRFERLTRRRAGAIRQNFSSAVKVAGTVLPCVINQDPQARMIGEGGTIDDQAKEVELAKADSEVAAAVGLIQTGTVAILGFINEAGAFEATTEDTEILDGIEGLDNESSPTIRFTVGNDAGIDL
jgi:hypothetical protein